MTVGSFASTKEEKEIDKVRRLNGLPPNRKMRSCMRCRVNFDSRGQRFCATCTYENAKIGHNCPWEQQPPRQRCK